MNLQESSFYNNKTNGITKIYNYIKIGMYEKNSLKISLKAYENSFLLKKRNGTSLKKLGTLKV